MTSISRAIIHSVAASYISNESFELGEAKEIIVRLCDQMDSIENLSHATKIFIADIREDCKIGKMDIYDMVTFVSCLGGDEFSNKFEDNPFVFGFFKWLEAQLTWREGCNNEINKLNKLVHEIY